MIQKNGTDSFVLIRFGLTIKEFCTGRQQEEYPNPHPSAMKRWINGIMDSWING